MGITTTASSRDADLRPSSTPERNRTLRHGAIEQLENDRFNDEECAPTEDPNADRGAIDRAWGRGWNAASRHAEGLLRVELGLLELKHAAVIRTVELEHAGLDLRVKDLLTGGES